MSKNYVVTLQSKLSHGDRKMVRVISGKDLRNLVSMREVIEASFKNCHWAIQCNPQGIK